MYTVKVNNIVWAEGLDFFSAYAMAKKLAQLPNRKVEIV